MDRSLSARGVKRMLTRAGVDWRALTITEQRITSRDAWNGGPWETYTEVRVGGPRLLLNTVWWALSKPGMSCASYPDHQLWSKSSKQN